MLKRLLIAPLWLVMAISCVAHAAQVQPAEDMQALYQDTQDSRVLLLLVSQPGCHYCDQIREEILEPMLASGLYTNTTLIREIKIYASKTLKDFGGKQVNATRFAERYDAWATPTLLFLDRNGEEVAEKMVGINTPEFYGYYVDKSLERAIAAASE